MSHNNNQLYPVFFRLDKLKLLIVGAGEVGMEKLHFILKSSPNANITIVAPWAREDVHALISSNQYNIRWIQKAFDQTDIKDHDIVIAATNISSLNYDIWEIAKTYNKIVNIADTPELCDFYMGSIVTRGDLKIALSSNGKSPTLIKRFRQLLEEIIPDDTHDLINNLKSIRDNLKGNFDYKVKKLNKITASLVSQDSLN